MLCVILLQIQQLRDGPGNKTGGRESPQGDRPAIVYLFILSRSARNGTGPGTQSTLAQYRKPKHAIGLAGLVSSSG